MIKYYRSGRYKMAFQERSIDQIRDVDPNSILAMLTGEPDDFTTIEGFIRWLTRRYDKLLIPFNRLTNG